MNVYHTLVHGRCPVKRTWDYYALSVACDGDIICEKTERAIDIVRGATMTREKMEKQISELLPGIDVSLVGVDCFGIKEKT